MIESLANSVQAEMHLQDLQTLRPREAAKERGKQDNPYNPAEATPLDSVSVSAEARELAVEQTTNEPSDPENPENRRESGEERSIPGEQLSEEEQREVQDLSRWDREVRAHEQAHLAAGGGVTSGGAKYEYETGPDGKRYAVGGEVSLSIPKGSTPEEDLRIARQVERTALAPQNPSAQDRAVAAQARSQAMEAQQQTHDERSSQVNAISANQQDEREEPALKGASALQTNPAEAEQQQEEKQTSPLDGMFAADITRRRLDTEA